MANTTCCARIDASGKAETHLRKTTTHANGLKNGTPSMGSFLDILESDWVLGTMAPKDTLDIGCSLITTVVPLVHAFLSKVLKSFN